MGFSATVCGVRGEKDASVEVGEEPDERPNSGSCRLVGIPCEG